MAESTESFTATVRQIRRATRKKYSAEEKVQIVLGACAVRVPCANCAAAKASRRICILSLEQRVSRSR